MLSSLNGTFIREGGFDLNRISGSAAWLWLKEQMLACDACFCRSFLRLCVAMRFLRCPFCYALRLILFCFLSFPFSALFYRMQQFVLRSSCDMLLLKHSLGSLIPHFPIASFPHVSFNASMPLYIPFSTHSFLNTFTNISQRRRS